MKKFTQNLKKTTALGLNWYFKPVSGDNAITFLELKKKIEKEGDTQEQYKQKCHLICMFLSELRDAEGDLIEMSESILYEHVDIAVIDSLYAFLAPADQKELLEKMMSNPALIERLISNQSKQEQS
jgi:hypothetical protein